MPWTQFLFVIAGVIIIYIIYLIALSVIRKQAAKNAKRNHEKAIQQQFIKTKLQQSDKPRYQLKSNVTSLTDKFLNEVLSEYCKKNNLRLVHKAKLADFLNPIMCSNFDFYESLKETKYTFVDFLICSSESFEPIAAVLIDDQWIGDETVEDILIEAGLEVFRFDDDKDRIIFDIDNFLKNKPW